MRAGQDRGGSHQPSRLNPHTKPSYGWRPFRPTTTPGPLRQPSNTPRPTKSDIGAACVSPSGSGPPGPEGGSRITFIPMGDEAIGKTGRRVSRRFVLSRIVGVADDMGQCHLHNGNRRAYCRRRPPASAVFRCACCGGGWLPDAVRPLPRVASPSAQSRDMLGNSSGLVV